MSIDPDFTNPNAHHLSHEQAKERDLAIEALEYDLSLKLNKHERYEGTLVVQAKLRQCEKIFLDFHGE
jgi:hypothetical protein